ncbi:MAG: FAD-dependent oxidoreductase [Bacilli bacterium]|nr:FAD-dependent oxidoreductase [Bacilli bacterium]
MSLWESYQTKQQFPSLQKHVSVNTLIIGGGMTGLNLLYFLKNQLDVCLVEANTIGAGVSKNTTGKINYLQENTWLPYLKKGKEDLASCYLDSQIHGMNLLLNICQTEKIDCNLEQVTSYLVTQKLEYQADLDLLQTFLQKKNISFVRDVSLFPSFLDGIGVTDTYVFHPLKYLLGLAQKLKRSQIYEKTKIVKIIKGVNCYFCHTDANYCIKAKQVVLACHYPFFLFPFLLPMKTQVQKSYLVAQKVFDNPKYTYITLESPSLSTRFYQEQDEIYQIYLGESHDIYHKQDDVTHFENVLKQFDIEPNSVESVWSNVDLMTLDHRAFVGEIAPSLFLATGYQTWGMIQSVLSAEILAHLLQGEADQYAWLFYPKRKNVETLFQYPLSFYQNVTSFLKSKFYPKSWYTDALSFTFQNGKIIAIYRDEQGIHKVHPVCPHMKCSLIFNEIEKTWDCPCHSSRFDVDGNWLKGPAKKNIGLQDTPKNTSIVNKKKY